MENATELDVEGVVVRWDILANQVYAWECRLRRGAHAHLYQPSHHMHIKRAIIIASRYSRVPARCSHVRLVTGGRLQMSDAIDRAPVALQQLGIEEMPLSMCAAINRENIGIL